MPSLLRCEMCGIDYPSAKFPDLSLGVVCDGCLTGQVSSKVEADLMTKTTAVARQLLSVEDSDVMSALPKLKGILAGVYREFGGPEGYAQHFFWLIQELSSRRPVPASVGALMLGFMKLHHAIENADETVAARDMTDEQIRREMELEMMRLVMDSSGDPEKRKMLEKVLGANGLKLERASPRNVLDTVSMDVIEAEVIKNRKFATGEESVESGKDPSVP